MLLLAGSLALCPAAFAQQAAPQAAPVQQVQPLSEEQRAAIARQDAEMGQAALQVMQLVDQGRAGDVWDGGSAVMKQLVAREEFVRQVGADRAALGALAGRSAPVVTRTQGQAGTALPEGLYINVLSATRFANQAQPIREMVSFRLDEDRVWRVIGYTVR